MSNLPKNQNFFLTQKVVIGKLWGEEIGGDKKFQILMSPEIRTDNQRLSCFSRSNG